MWVLKKSDVCMIMIIKEKTKKNGKCLKLVINRDIITQYGGKLGKLHIYIYIYLYGVVRW